MPTRFVEFFQQAPIGYLITDGFGLIVEANPAAGELLATTPEGLRGKPLASFVLEEDRRAFRDRMLDIATTEPLEWRTWLRSRRGRPFTAELHLSRSHEELGKLHWTLADVSQRVAVEEELRLLATELEARVADRARAVQEERARLEVVVANMPAGLVIVDLDGQVLLANDQAQKILGVKGELPEREWEGFGDDGHRYASEDFPLARTLLTGDVIRGERIELVAADGSTVFLDVSTAPVRDRGKMIGALALFQDVSAQEQRERAERNFVTNAAHQLQSPLAAILSAVEVLQAGAKEGPERDIFLAHIERESTRLARLTRALLILARAQTGFESPRAELVPLKPLLEDIAGSFRPASGVEMQLSCPNALAVISNRELIEQALMNVVENAVKYTKHGKITVAAEGVEGDVEIVVRDTGIGIAESDQPHVLDRFYRGTSENGAPGFGLGFAIVRAAVDALGGELKLVSDESRGTTVEVKLPRAATIVPS